MYEGTVRKGESSTVVFIIFGFWKGEREGSEGKGKGKNLYLEGRGGDATGREKESKKESDLDTFS